MEKPARTRLLLAALALLAAAVVVRVPGLGRSLWYDELFTVRNFLDKWSHPFFRQREANNHPLASALAWLASRVTGSEAPPVLRAPSVALGAAGVLAVAWLAARRRRLADGETEGERDARPGWGLAAGTAAALLALVHPTHVGYSQELRGYAGVLLAGPLVVGLSLSLLEGGGRRTARALIVSLGLGLYAHLTVGVLALGALVHALLARDVTGERRRATIRALVLGLLLGAALYAPLWRTLGSFASRSVALPATTGGAPTTARLAEIGALLGGDARLLPSGVAPSLPGAALALLVLVGLVASVREKDRLATASGAVLATALVLWIAARPLFYARFFLFLLPLALVLAGRGAAAIARAAPSRFELVGALAVASPLLLVLGLATRERATREVQPIEPALAFARAVELGPPCVVGTGAILVDPGRDAFLDESRRKSLTEPERDQAVLDAACAAIGQATTARPGVVVVELMPDVRPLGRAIVETAARHRLIEEAIVPFPGLEHPVVVHVLRKP